MTGRKEAQTVEEMITEMNSAKEKQLAPDHRGQTIYKAQSGEYVEEKLKSLLSCKLEELADVATAAPVSLEDTEEIKHRAIAYLRCCQETATYPSSLGFARSLGYSNRSLEIWRHKKPEHETSKFLQIFAELCADILHDSSLKNNCNSIVTIFLSKAIYDLTENNELTIKNGGMVEEESSTPSIEEIRKRYLHDED